MNFDQALKAIPALLDAGVNIELLSPPGVGKSEFVEALPEVLSKRDGHEWGFTSMFLATYTPSDLMGYMVPQKVETGLVSVFTTPAWMVTQSGKLINEYKRGIILMDEYGQGEADVKRASAQLLLRGEVGPHRLHKGIGIIACSNRASDRSGVSKSFDFVINRRVEINIEPTIQGLVDHYFKIGVDPVLITFANQNPGVVLSGQVPDKQGPWCTPRSLVMVDKALKQLRGAGEHFPTDALAMELSSGLIGSAATAQLMAFIKLGQEMPSFDEIKKRPKEAKLPSKPDAQMLVCYSLAARVEDEDMESVITYVERMPKEFAVTFAKAAIRRDQSLVNTAAVGNWCVRNTTLMSAIQDSRA